jgi:hypothetical protein
MRRLLRRRAKPQEPTSPDHYTPPSFRGPMLMLAVSIAGIVLVWLAYSWALASWPAP